MAKKKYFPNNWKKLKNAPAELFDSVSFEEFMSWKIAGWEIMSSHCCIIREQDIESGKVKEHSFKRPKDAENKIKRLIEEAKSEFVVCDEDDLTFLYPKYLDDD